MVPSQIVFRFGRHDLLRTRFAISPLIELAAATYVVRLPTTFPEHRRWIEDVAPRIVELPLDLLYAASPLGRTSWPNFDAPPPVVPHPRIEDELARVAATDPRLVRADVIRAYHPGEVPPDAQPFLEDTGAALAGFVEQSRAFWDAAIAPWWPRMAAFLESEIAARARRLATVGGAAAFSDLDPTVTWDGRELTVSPVVMRSQQVDLNGRGLLLIPSVLAWSVWPRVAAPWDPALTYQPPGVGDLWLQTPSEGAVEALIGRRRARLLRSLERPASTLALARRTGWSPGGVNSHLTVLRRAGLVVRRREGRNVVYTRTAAGDDLCSDAR